MTVGIRHDDLRRRNRAMVISAVRRGGQTSRTGIAAITGLRKRGFTINRTRLAERPSVYRIIGEPPALPSADPARGRRRS